MQRCATFLCPREPGTRLMTRTCLSTRSVLFCGCLLKKREHFESVEVEETEKAETI